MTSAYESCPTRLIPQPLMKGRAFIMEPHRSGTLTSVVRIRGHAKLNPSNPIVFGPFKDDDSSGELRKQGKRIRLQGQPLQILSGLLAQPGQVVSREEFQQQLWQGSTFVDFEHGLNAAVNRLRQVLGDSAEQPRYIETIPGRGYRLIAPFQVASPTAIDRSPPSSQAWRSPRLASRPVRRTWMWVSGIIAGVTNCRPSPLLT